MSTTEHILAELTAYGCLALFGWAIRLLLALALPATQGRPNRRSEQLIARTRREKQLSRTLPIVVGLVMTGLCAASTSGAQQLPSAPAPQPTAMNGTQPATASGTVLDSTGVTPAPQLASISGTVMDTNGGIIPGAKVALSGDTPDKHLETVAADNGFFQLSNVQPGATYHVTVTAPDFADWTSAPITVTPGQYFLLSGVELRVSTVETVVVSVPSEEIATEQLNIEEKQRVLGVVPNFYVNFDRHPASLTPKLKFRLALKALNDPVTLTAFAVNAGIYQAADYPSYHGGMQGYGQRLGATVAGGYAHIMMGGAVLPSLLHQDPRYFYQTGGTTRSQVMHALSSAIFTRGDDGRREINYSNLGGDLISGAIANAYYPAQDRGAGLVIRSSLIGTGGRIVYALGEQFVLNRRHKSN